MPIIWVAAFTVVSAIMRDIQKCPINFEDSYRAST